MKRIFSWVLAFMMVAAFMPLMFTEVAMAAGVTLDEAKKTPGLYIKDGNSFTPISPQYSLNPSGYSSYTVNGTGVSGLFAGSASNMMAILFDADYQIPKIPHNAQLVLIGVESIGIYQTFNDGWTIPIGVSLGIWPALPGLASSPESLLLNYSRSTWGSDDRSFETLNGKTPTDYRNRMLYTCSEFNLMRFHGLLTGTRDEQFTFGWWQGTDWIDKTYTANKRFFTLPSQYTYSDKATNADFEIVKTPNGYFEIKFSTPPSGFYGIGSSMHHLDRVVEFVSPPSPLDSASSWARDAIVNATAIGYVPSDIQNNYANVITRAEFCRMAVKWVEYVTGKNIDTILTEKGLSRNQNAFTDTKDPDILAAFALGITSGTGNNQFTPNGQFSREQAATMIMNTCKAIGADISNPTASGFADLNTASSWAVDGINFVRANGIMSGTGNNNFSPKSTYTREQSVVTFNNIDPNVLPVSKPTSRKLSVTELRKLRESVPYKFFSMVGQFDLLNGNVNDIFSLYFDFLFTIPIDTKLVNERQEEWRYLKETTSVYDSTVVDAKLKEFFGINPPRSGNIICYPRDFTTVTITYQDGKYNVHELVDAPDAWGYEESDLWYEAYQIDDDCYFLYGYISQWGSELFDDLPDELKKEVLEYGGRFTAYLQKVNDNGVDTILVLKHVGGFIPESTIQLEFSNFLKQKA